MDAFLQWMLEHWSDITVSMLLFILLYGGSRKQPWWVFGREYQEEREEKLEWRKAALSGTGLAQKATSIAEKKVKK